MAGTDTGVVGLDFVIPTRESQARVVLWEDIPVTPESEPTTTLSATEVTYEVAVGTGEVVEPESVGEIDALDIFQPASVATLTRNVELYYTMGWLKNAEIREGLLDKLKAAQELLNRGQTKVTKNQLRAFINQT